MLKWGVLVFMIGAALLSNPEHFNLTASQVDVLWAYVPMISAAFILIALGEAVFKAFWRGATGGQPFGGFFAPLIDVLGNALTASRQAGMKSSVHYDFIRGKMSVAQRRFYQGTVIFMVIGALYCLFVVMSGLMQSTATKPTIIEAIQIIMPVGIFAVLMTAAIIVNEQIEVRLWLRHQKEFWQIHTVETVGTDRRGRPIELWKLRDASDVFGAEASTP